TSDRGDLVTYREGKNRQEHIGYRDFEACQKQCSPTAQEKKFYEAVSPLLPTFLPYLQGKERVAFPQVSSEVHKKSGAIPFDIKQVTDNYKRCFRWMTSPQMAKSFSSEDAKAITEECTEHFNIWFEPFWNAITRASSKPQEGLGL